MWRRKEFRKTTVSVGKQPRHLERRHSETELCHRQKCRKRIMKNIKRLGAKIGIALCGALLGCASYGQPSISVSASVPLPSVEVQIHAESDFYEPLAPQGEWLVVGSYGRCWRPGHVDRDWRPYCNGNWQRTDAGWYWASDEPWAWATYHYGRWDFTDQYGWYWMPQIQWAPAWVSWHDGGGYVGWAPLQPSVSISGGAFVGFNESRIPQRGFVFVEQGRFLDPIRPATVAVTTPVIISRTTFVNTTVINGGPTTVVIEKATGRPVQPVQAQELRHKDEAVVVNRQRTATATSEKRVREPVLSKTGRDQEKAVAAPAPPPIPRPVAPAKDFSKPAPKYNDVPNETRKPTLAAVAPKPEPTPAARPESSHPPVIQEPARQIVHEQPAKLERVAQPSEKREQQPARQNPAPGEKAQSGPAEQGHEDKPKN
jgi:hypothetical protein